MRLAVVAIVACSSSPAPPPESPRKPAPARPTFASWRTLATPVEVIVLDDYRTHESCDGVAARRIEVRLDDKLVTATTVPCSTQVRAPPQQYAAPAFVLLPGTHVVRVRDTSTGVEAEAVVEVPVVEPPYGEVDDDAPRTLATKLPIWANEDELEVQALRASMSSL